MKHKDYFRLKKKHRIVTHILTYSQSNVLFSDLNIPLFLLSLGESFLLTVFLHLPLWEVDWNKKHHSAKTQMFLITITLMRKGMCNSILSSQQYCQECVWNEVYFAEKIVMNSYKFQLVDRTQRKGREF